MKRVWLAIAFLLFAAGQVYASPELDPRAVNLTLRDMPPGFRLSYSSGGTVKQQSASITTLPVKEGYVDYVKRDGLSGLHEVWADVSVYRSTADAATACRSLPPVLRPNPFRRVPIGPIGTHGIAYVVTQPYVGHSTTTVDLYFFRGPYCVNIAGKGPTSTFSMLQIYTLAKIIDRRILTHG